METVWYVALTCAVTMYVLLDGYDFGVAMLVPRVAATESERRMVRATIGPVWTGNEVWLIAVSGLLFLAFPRAYAAGFSGFYLGLMMWLWLLVGRGLAFELREHIAHPLWRRFWDGMFALSGLSLAFLLGVLAGNVSRGVPLNEAGYFFLPLWTNFQPGSTPGMLDWFTMLAGVTMVVVLALHGATYLAMQTTGPLRATCRTVATILMAPAVLTLPALYAALAVVQPAIQAQYLAHPAGVIWPLATAAALFFIVLFHRRGRQAAAFMSSSLLVVSVLVTMAWGLYPNLLIATDPANSVTITGAAAEPSGLRAALWWVPPGFALVVLYQWFIHRTFAGPVTPETAAPH